MTQQNTGKIRNLKGFISSYLSSKTGTTVLDRKPYHVYGKGQVWATSQMANAFKQSIA